MYIPEFIIGFIIGFISCVIISGIFTIVVDKEELEKIDIAQDIKKFKKEIKKIFKKKKPEEIKTKKKKLTKKEIKKKLRIMFKD